MLLQKIRKESNVPIIMVTSKNTETDEVLSLSYGANDYITKPYNPTILLLRINNLFKRIENKNDILTYNDLTVDPKKGIIKSDKEELILTKNEMIIFTFLLANRGNIVTRDDLMTDLWNNDSYINDNALNVNISRLRTKLTDFGYGFIREFPAGYNTMIVEGGNNVSGGQKQRLCIARALLKKPKILILDDSTSAVDTRTDALIRQAFREEIPDTTKIIIAQRISSVEDADMIIVMDNGEINGIGTSEELLKTNAIYREVYESQIKGGAEDE